MREANDLSKDRSSTVPESGALVGATAHTPAKGPQHVTVHGRDEVVIIAADEFRRLKGGVSGEALIKAMQASPYRDIKITPHREPMPVRDISW